MEAYLYYVILDFMTTAFFCVQYINRAEIKKIEVYKKILRDNLTWCYTLSEYTFSV